MVTASPTSGIPPTRSRAARLLQANGAPSEYRRAIFAYNRADWYVDAVLAKAKEYRGAFAPGASGGARVVLTWAVTHVGRFTYNLDRRPIAAARYRACRGGEPTGSTCDCSMFVRWAMAQAGLDVGLTTSTQWTANGRLPVGDSSQDTAVVVSRGVGHAPGGYRPGDLVFFGVDDGPTGHVALSLGNGQIVHCLIERRRVQHSSPGRLCRADGLAQVEGGVRVDAENVLSAR